MAQDTEIILFEAQFDAAKADENILGLTKTLTRLRAEKKALEADFKSGTIGLDEYAKSTVALNRNIASTSREIQSENKALEQNTKARKTAEGSIVQMRAQLSVLTSGYDNLSAAERNNEAVGGKLKAQTAALVAELKTLESQTGRDQRNVGNYSGSIVELGERLSDLKSQYENLTEAQRNNQQVGGALAAEIQSLTDQQTRNTSALTQGQKSTVDYIKQLNIMGINVGEVADSLKSGTSNLGGFAKSILTGQGALIAFSAVPIILILTALVSFFTKSKDGAELFGRKMAGLTAIFSVFSKFVSGVGREVSSAFDNPASAVEKFGQLVKENLTNRFTAFKVILDAIKNVDLKGLFNGFVQLFTGITDSTGKFEKLTAEAKRAAAAGEAIAAENYRIADAERLLNVERAKSRASIEKNKLLSEDVTKSTEQRLAAAQAAFGTENALLAKQEGLQRAKIANINAENALQGKTKEGLDKLADAEAELGNIQEESFGKQTELQNKVNEIRIAGAQAALAIAIAQANKELQLAEASGTDTFEIRKKILDKQLAFELAAIVKGSDQEKALQLKYDLDLAQLQLDNSLKATERLEKLDIARIDAKLLRVRRGSKEEIDLLKQRAEAELSLQATQNIQEIKNEEEQSAEYYKQQLELRNRLKELDRQYRDIERSEAQAGIDARLAQSKVGSAKELDAQIASLILQQQTELDNADLTQRQIAAIKAKYLRQEEDLLRSFREQQVNQVLDLTSNASDALGKLFDSQTQKQQLALDQQKDAQLRSAGLSAEARANIEERFAKKKEELDKKAAEKRRKIATIENIIGIARGIVAAQTNPFPLNIIQSALVIATGAAQQAVIASQQFARGGVAPEGVISGPSHSQGGIQMHHKGGAHLGEMEGGEIVLTRRVNDNPVLRSVASMINEMAGGKRFAPSIATRPMFSVGGITALQSRAGAVAGVEIDYNRLAGVLSAMPAPIVRVVDIQFETAKKVAVSNRADIG